MNGDRNFRSPFIFIANVLSRVLCPWKRKVLYPALAVLGTAILLLALYILVARLFPGVMDGLLYNNEDYEILHNISQFKN